MPFCKCFLGLSRGGRISGKVNGKNSKNNERAFKFCGLGGCAQAMYCEEHPEPTQPTQGSACRTLIPQVPSTLGHVIRFEQLPVGAFKDLQWSFGTIALVSTALTGPPHLHQKCACIYAKYKQKNDRLKAAPNGMRVNSAMLANTGDYIHVHSQTLCET